MFKHHNELFLSLLSVMEETIPVDTTWERPKINKRSVQQKKDEFKKELEKTKKILSNTTFKAPPITASRQSSTESQKKEKLFSMKSLSIDSESDDKSIPVASRGRALGAMGDWRGVTEGPQSTGGGSDTGSPRKLSGDSTSTSKSTGRRKLSVMLRSTGGKSCPQHNCPSAARYPPNQILYQ